VDTPIPESRVVSRHPVFLDLWRRKVVLVGGGTIALSKLPALLETGAQVTVVAPQVLVEIVESGVTVARRAFSPEDLDGAWFVVAAATPEVNRAVAEAAEERRIFVNAVDDVRSATAYLGGVVRRGEITIAISTGGAAPALAGLLREGLDAALPPEIQTWVDEGRQLRVVHKAAGVPMTERRPALLAALNRLYEGRARA
jgi:uroporphyrin-III C-methyltransferase/precorrin-2 dehydrogenase/sirohydrochlorin ferrochelatase